MGQLKDWGLTFVPSGRALRSGPNWAGVQAWVRPLLSGAISRGNSRCLCNVGVTALSELFLQGDGQVLKGQRAWASSKLQNGLCDIQDPFAAEGVFTESLHRREICPETHFPRAQAGRCWKLPSPAPSAVTGPCYLSGRTYCLCMARLA